MAKKKAKLKLKIGRGARQKHFILSETVLLFSNSLARNRT